MIKIIHMVNKKKIKTFQWKVNSQFSSSSINSSIASGRLSSDRDSSDTAQWLEPLKISGILITCRPVCTEVMGIQACWLRFSKSLLA